MADSQTSRTSASHETRQTLSERNTRRLELAKQMGKTVDDLIWDPNEMAFTWDDMQSETTTTLANGEPTNTMDAAMVEHNDVMTIIAAYSKRDLLQPGLPPYIPSTIATIPPKDASRFLALMNGEHILAKDWAPIRNALQARHPLKQDIIVRTQTMFTVIMSEIIDTGIPFWVSDPSADTPNYGAMYSVARHAARMLGIFDETDMRDALTCWNQLRYQVPDEEAGIWHAINGASWALSDVKEKYWPFLMWNLRDVYMSKAILYQVSLFVKLVDYLGSYPEDWPEGLKDPLETARSHDPTL